MSAALTTIPLGQADLIMIDPPWKFKTYSAKGLGKSPEAHYKTMTMDEIAALPVKTWGKRDCLLLCWATFPLLDRQLAIVEGWGFKYRSAVIWHKIFPSGKNAYGTGFRVRSMCEPMLIATRGEPKQTKAFGGIFRGIRRENSRKPEEIYDIIDACCANLTNRIDVFARQSRPGWGTYGDEATKFDAAA